MLDQGMAAYTFSKSYSMSGWRLGFAVTSPKVVEAVSKMINTTLSCTPPFVQLAGKAALEQDAAQRDQMMLQFRRKVKLLTDGLNRLDGFHVLEPAGSFYVFANVKPICEQLRITSHGLAMFLLEAADDQLGIACLGGECFGEAGAGFLRFSCAEPDERLEQALEFLPTALNRQDRLTAYLNEHPEFLLPNQAD